MKIQFRIDRVAAILWVQMGLLAMFMISGVATGFIFYSPIIILYLIPHMGNVFGMGISQKFVRRVDKIYTAIWVGLYILLFVLAMLTTYKETAPGLAVFIGAACVVQLAAIRKGKSKSFPRLATKIGKGCMSKLVILRLIFIISTVIYLVALICLQKSLTIECLLGMTAPVVLFMLLNLRSRNNLSNTLNCKVLGVMTICLMFFCIGLVFLSLCTVYYFYGYKLNPMTISLISYNVINIFSFIGMGLVYGVLKPRLRYSNRS